MRTGTAGLFLQIRVRTTATVHAKRTDHEYCATAMIKETVVQFLLSCEEKKGVFEKNKGHQRLRVVAKEIQEGTQCWNDAE